MNETEADHIFMEPSKNVSSSAVEGSEDKNVGSHNAKDFNASLVDERVNPNFYSTDKTFKKPLVVGCKLQKANISSSMNETFEIKQNWNVESKSCFQNSLPVPYTEPIWRCKIKEPYSLEVLKSGVIVETVHLSHKSYFVFGRQSNCDIQLAHPTVSRHHAVVQHGALTDASTESGTCKDSGIYIYDLGSTHGTFVNKVQIPKQRYIRLHVGHMVKFGGSTRSYILVGPESDVEKESEKSVTELKEEAKHKHHGISAEMRALCKEKEVNEDDQGIDWGLGEDADEETDLSENPFASTQNEELYLDDPKKSLRGWFDREGEDLEYAVEEKSFGQFLCQVKLPLDDAYGKPLVAEALVKGKKKEAVVQCALEACRILDRMGLLRQANHESKKRKARNWEEDDFYASDEDTFLDRTGTVEKKREKRMRSAGKLDTKVDTYESLLKKYEEICEKMKNIEEAINVERRRQTEVPKERETGEEGEDALDAFMSTLNQKTLLDKVDIRRLKVNFAELTQEEAHLRKLINIARPTCLPEVQHPHILLASKTKEDKEFREEIGNFDEKVQVSPCEISKSVLERKKKTEAKGSKTKIESEEDEKIFLKEIQMKNLPSDSESILIENKKESVQNSNNLVKTGEVKNNVQSKVHEPTFMLEPGGAKLINYDGPIHLEIKSTEKKSQLRSVKKQDEIDPDYSLWMPPQDQTGDGKTKLNEKYGY